MLQVRKIFSQQPINMIPNLIIQLRNFIYQTLYRFDSLLNRKADIIILCYHSIVVDNWKYSVSPDEFAAQMAYLKKEFNFISIDDLYLYLSGKKPIKKPVAVITFDDGYKNLLSVESLIKKFDIKPAIFILSDPVTANTKEMGKSIEFLSEKDIARLYREGWTLGCHSATHPDFWKLREDEIKKEVKESKKTLERNLNCKVNFFAYPKGRYTPEILQQIEEAGYHLAFSMDDGPIRLSSNKYTLPRIGIDKTHNLKLFKATISPSVIFFRSLVKKTPLSKFL